MTHLILYTKSKCHLCEVMKGIIIKLKIDFDFEFEIVDIEVSEELFEKYKAKIPVLMINGKIFAKYSLDENKLRKKLQSLESSD